MGVEIRSLALYQQFESTPGKLNPLITNQILVAKIQFLGIIEFP